MAKKPRSEATELFASPGDIDKAQQIAEEVLGKDVKVDYTSLPKNIGQMGDEGFRGHSVVISAGSEVTRRAIMADQGTITDGYPALADASLRITNETHAATRVLFDITPNNGYFEVADDKHDEKHK